MKRNTFKNNFKYFNGVVLLFVIFFISILSSVSMAEDIKNTAKTKLKNELDNLSNAYIEKSVNYIQSLPLKFFGNEIKTKEIDISLENNTKPKVGILFLTPFFDSTKIEDTFFMQNSLSHRDNRTTINTGLGYRKLTMDNNLLIGVNGFYDHEFPYNHGRTSLGLEARTSFGQINANEYWSTRDWVTAKSSDLERALSGHDIEASIPIPYMNWSNLSYKKFHWHGNNIENIGGSETSLTAVLPMMPNLSIKINRFRYNSSDTEDKDTLTLSYIYNNSKKKLGTNSLISKNAYQLKSMENLRFDKIKRENEIIKEVDANGTFSFKGV